MREMFQVKHGIDALPTNLHGLAHGNMKPKDGTENRSMIPCSPHGNTRSIDRSLQSDVRYATMEAHGSTVYFQLLVCYSKQ